jgi:hypothetical protein
MSEKYINAYIDSAVGIIHENLNTILQLKAQLRVTNELLGEKDSVINSQIAEKDNTINLLSSELSSLKSRSVDVEELKKNAKYWEDSYHAINNKVAHMETLTKQYNDLKSQFFTVNEELKLTKLKIEEFETVSKTPKKTLNIKNSVQTNKVEDKRKEILIDDF